MNSTTYDELIELLTKFKKERNALQKQIDDNLLQIYEAQSYTKEILEKEEEDFKVFSPRKIEDIYKDELEQSNVKRLDYENRNEALIAKREELDSIILVLDKVYREISQNVSSEEVEEFVSSDMISEMNSDNEDSIKVVINESMQNLNQLIHKIELSAKFIHQDPMRSKLELEIINKGIMEVANQLNRIIIENE